MAAYTYTYASRYANAILNAAGTPQASLSVTVFLTDGVTKATLWTSDAKVSNVSNPITTDTYGNCLFWADPGEYILSFTPSGGSLTTVEVELPVNSKESIPNVSQTAPTSTNQGLLWNGTTWVPTTITAAMVTNAADKSSAAQQLFTGELKTPDLVVAGLTGATAASRYVGATASGAPASGTFALGDFVIDQTGKVWVCTAAGTPGTWTQVGGTALHGEFEIMNLISGSLNSNAGWGTATTSYTELVSGTPNPTGTRRLFNTALTGVTTYFEAAFAASTGSTAGFELFDVTAGAAVANSAVTTTTVNATTVTRSAAITLVAGHIYAVYGFNSAGVSSFILGARVVGVF